MVDLFSDKKIKLCCDWDRCICDCSNLNEIRSLARKGEIGWDVFESHLSQPPTNEFVGLSLTIKPLTLRLLTEPCRPGPASYHQSPKWSRSGGLHVVQC